MFIGLDQQFRSDFGHLIKEPHSLAYSCGQWHANNRSIVVSCCYVPLLLPKDSFLPSLKVLGYGVSPDSFLDAVLDSLLAHTVGYPSMSGNSRLKEVNPSQFDFAILERGHRWNLIRAVAPGVSGVTERWVSFLFCKSLLEFHLLFLALYRVIAEKRENPGLNAPRWHRRGNMFLLFTRVQPDGIQGFVQRASSLCYATAITVAHRNQEQPLISLLSEQSYFSRIL